MDIFAENNIKIKNFMRKIKAFLTAFVLVAALAACGKDDNEPVDTGNGGNNDTEEVVPEDPDNNEGEEDDSSNVDEYTVDEHGYATFTYKGFSYKMKEGDAKDISGKNAIQNLREDIDFIVTNIPENALAVMRKRPIWMERNNKHNSSAAWYHTWAGYPASIGDLDEKGKCVEITNYNKYVSWSRTNQPLMVLHELCHLYHDQGLGGENNQVINQAYQNAKDKGLYKEGWYRSDTSYNKQSQWTKVTDVYCMNTVWEYFAEMCEAYWGENDYYPFNYELLKKHDPVGFAMMESIWGKR